VAAVWLEGEVVSLTRRDVLTFAGIISLVVLVAIAGLVVLQPAKPRVSQAAATAVALQWVAQMDPTVHGFAVVSARYEATPDRIYDDRGNMIYSVSHTSCPIWRFQGPGWLCHSDGVWVVHLRAPAQGEFANHEGWVFVNGQNGTVSGASTNAS
jgi:hypothetical protein